MFERWTYHLFPLTVGTKAWKGGIAVLDTATGKVKPGVTGTGLLYIGRFAESVDASAAEKPVNVDLSPEIEVVWWNNDTGGAITATMVGGPAYVLDDQTVTATATGRSLAGRVWAVDALRGVAVQRVSQTTAAALVAADETEDDDDAPTVPPLPPSAKPDASKPPTTPTAPAAPARK